ncbi:MAG: hypothetical protein ACR2MB_11760 [Acidimicrobiales bacterium]
MIVTWAGYCMAGLLLITGAGLILVPFNRGLQPYLKVGESIRNWAELLASRPSQVQILSSNQFGYRAKIPHHRGWYMCSAGQVVRGRACRVHVGPDQLARIEYVDDWSGQQLLDSSTFCLQLTDASDAVNYFNRSGRFEIVLHDDRIRSLDGYPMNCHLAVHYSIDVGIDEPVLLERLMHRLPTLEHEIEERVAGALRDEFSQSEYREALYKTPDTVTRLNRAWATDSDLHELHEALTVHFSALVVKPREEAERRFLSTPDAGMARLDDRISRVDEDLQREARHWDSRAEDTNTALRNAVRELLDYPPEAIRKAATGLHNSVREMGSGERVVQSVNNMFLGGQRALARGADQFVDALQSLQSLIQSLAERDSELRSALNQRSAGSPGEATPSLIDLDASVTISAGVARLDNGRPSGDQG